MMKYKYRIFQVLPFLLFASSSSLAQERGAISETEVTRIEKVLSADDMQGRQVFTPGIDKAAAFIISEFKSAGLIPLPGQSDYQQHFTIVNPTFRDATITLDGLPLDKKNIAVFSPDSVLRVTDGDPYKKVTIKTPADFNAAFFKYFESEENVILFIDTAFSKRFTRLANFHAPQFKGSGNRIFILTAKDPHSFQILIRQNIKEQPLTNIVGILPGKTKPAENVIFSAHYDHLGIGKANAAGDSIYNGANDDASGITAVITLAKHFNSLHTNERTLLFAAFTAEEVGEFGSAYFSKQLNPDQIVAMFNIEMIGTESKWGKNSAYITGFDKTDMGTILQKNLMNSPFRFYPDPYPDQMLFLRSDNATLAKKGVPAHTISTSKMDSEKYYHQLGDEIGTLDMANMTEIIRSIALSAGSVISGKDTPQRVKTDPSAR